MRSGPILADQLEQVTNPGGTPEVTTMWKTLKESRTGWITAVFLLWLVLLVGGILQSTAGVN